MEGGGKNLNGGGGYVVSCPDLPFTKRDHG